jgi:putative ABC transport system permease protein
MLINYLKIIARTFRRERFHSIINLFGLTTGLTAFILIGLFVRKELSYDRFHGEQDSLFRMIQVNDKTGMRNGFVLSDFAKIVKEEFPEVVSYSRLSNDQKRNLLQVNENGHYTNGFYYTDADFFEMFDFKLVDGVEGKVLNKPLHAVITQSLAARLFGEINPIGEEILLNKEKSLIVSGVCQDVPDNSSIQFEILVKAPEGQFKNTLNEGFVRMVIAFLQLERDTDIDALEAKVNASRALENYKPAFDQISFDLIPITDQHLRSGLDIDTQGVSDMKMIYLFSGIGLIILLLAIINYVNMVIARQLRKGREVGLRRVIGANRVHLITYQFAESIVVTTLSIILAFAIAERLVPILNGQFDLALELDYFTMDFMVSVPLTGLTLGLLSGLYPAWHISRKKPLSLLTNSTDAVGGKIISKRILVGFQFSVAGVMILITVIMQSQMSFMKNKEIGFEKDLLVHIPLFEEVKGDSEIFKREVINMAGVSSSTVSNWMIGRYRTTVSFGERRGDDRESSPPYTRHTLVIGDQDFVKTLDVKVIRKVADFTFNTLNQDQIMISESMIDQLGWQNDVLGKYLYTRSGEAKKIVAIVEDFHSRSYREEREPTVIQMGKPSSNQGLLVRYASVDHEQTLMAMKDSFEELFQRPFEFSYMNDEIDRFYRREAGQVRLFNTFSSLAVLLSLLGLVAMASYTTKQRQKEVSIRKVLGASAKELIILLNKEQTGLTLVAFGIAIPVAIYSMKSWLESFKYRIEIEPYYFVLTILGFLLLNTICTLAYTLRVSRANPADTLRNE